MLQSWGQLVAGIRKEDNAIWKDFIDQVMPQLEEQMKEKGVRLSDEELNQQLSKIFSSAQHPVYNYAHVYKCPACPENHINIVNAVLLEVSISSSRDVAHNVKLAFELAESALDGGTTFAVSEIFPELLALTVQLEDNSFTVFTLKENAESVEAYFLKQAPANENLH